MNKPDFKTQTTIVIDKNDIDYLIKLVDPAPSSVRKHSLMMRLLKAKALIRK